MEDRRAGGPSRLLVIVAIGVAACSVSSLAATEVNQDTGTLLARIGDRVANYYRRAQSIVCLESSTVQPIDRSWSPQDVARTVESELHVESEAGDGSALPEATVVRDVRRVNGRPPRERDKKDRAGCTDPNPLSPEPLAFLLPSHREQYRFTSVREGRERNRAARVIDFVSVDKKSRPELIEDDRGHDDCFDWSGPIATGGRLWVDAVTDEVLRVDRFLQGPVELKVPQPLQRRYNFAPWLVLERDDVTMRYREVAFSDPEEMILLPESIDSLTMLRSGLQSVRRTVTFSGYRRFLTTGRIVKGR